MKESTITKISIITAVLGLLVLFVLSQYIKPKEIQIKDIKTEDDAVTLKGKISKVRNMGNTTIITIEQTNKIDVVVFNTNNETKSQLKANDIIKVEGKTKLYQDNYEIIADKIEKSG